MALAVAALILMVLPLSQTQRVDVSIDVGGFTHTFAVTDADTADTILARAQPWCTENMAINNPSCPSAISNRAEELRAIQNEDSVASFAQALGFGLPVDRRILNQLRELAGFFAGSNSTVAANAHYLWSLALRRYQPTGYRLPEHDDAGKMAAARWALGRALLITPPEDEMQTWKQEYSSFLATVECVVSEDDAETDVQVHLRTLHDLVDSVETSYADKALSVELLLQTAQRLHQHSRFERCIDATADVCLLAAFRIIGRADAFGAETRRLRFLALRILQSIRPTEGASGLASLVEDQGKVSPVTSALELLWTAYAQLRPAYASTGDSESAIDHFIKYTHRARAVSSSRFFEAERSTDAMHVLDLIKELPLVPHWRLGFSGPSGRDLATALSDWSATVRLVVARNELSRDFTKSEQSETSSSTESPRRRQAVGFVSSWFCNSAVGRLMLGLVRELDRERFQVHVFHVASISGRLNRDDSLTLDFDAAADVTHIVDLGVDSESDQKAAIATLAGARLDAVVFCDIGMDPATYLLAFNRYAKVQVVFWGHPFTSGIRNSIDYYVLPFGAEEPIPGFSAGLTDSSERYIEQLVRFETTGSFFDTIPSISDAAPWDHSFANRNETLLSMAQAGTIGLLGGDIIDESFLLLEARIYACLQHCGKFHPLLDDLLLSILGADPQAFLLVRDCGRNNPNDPSLSSRLNNESGYASRILVLREQLPLGDFMRLMGAAHVALEPFPFPASITTLDAFAAGTPVVAHGGILVSRGMAQLSAGLYRRMGIEDCCVARDLEDYVALAVKLACNVNGARDAAVKILKERRGFIFEDREAVQEWEHFFAKTIDTPHKDSALGVIKTASKEAQGSSLANMLAKLLSADKTEYTSALKSVVHLVSPLFSCHVVPSSNLGTEWQQVREAACHAFDVLLSASEDQNEHGTVAAWLQEAAGVSLWGLQVFDSLSTRLHHSVGGVFLDSADYLESIGRILADCSSYSEQDSNDAVNSTCLTVAAAAAATAALALDPLLINAAAFGAKSYTQLGLWDGAATFYATAAQLKRPFFWGALVGGNESYLTSRVYTSSKSTHFDWRAAAEKNPLEASRRGFDGGIEHPSSNLDLGGDSNLMGPFNTIQFGGYNSAQLRHLSSQLLHLVETQKALPIDFLEVATELSTFADSLDAQRGGVRWEPEVQGLLPAESVHVSLAHTESSNGSHFARTLAVLGRTVYLRPTPALRGGALHSKFAVSARGDRTEATKIESEFVTSSVAVADDLLSKQAVSELRAFCEDSTFFHKNYIQGYVGAFMGDGFGAAGLIHQIAAELIAAFPLILSGRRLVQAWSYKYDDGHARGIDPHSDAGAVSVNLWLTPDDSNLDPDTGGLIIWPESPPENWTFGQANLDTASVRAHLDNGSFEDQPTSLEKWRRYKMNEGATHGNQHKTKVLRVPYRENRCILFESRLFHQTDKIRFRSGYRNRRINVTFLFL